MAQSPSIEAPRKLFSVEEANKSLPLVRAIVEDIVRQFLQVHELRQRLSSLSSARGRSGRSATNDIYSEELAQSQAELEAQEALLKEYHEELVKLGVELKSADGLCDFPSSREGRLVYLSWRLGEPEVLYWHEKQAGHDARQPIRSLVRTQRGGESHEA